MGALQSVPIDASCCACGGLEHKLPAGRIELDPVPEKPSSARSTRGRHALQSRISSEKYACEQKTQQPSRPFACENDDVRLPTLMTSSFLCDPMQAAVCMTMPACDVTEPLAVRITTTAVCGAEEHPGHLSSFPVFGSSTVQTASCHGMLATTQEASMGSLKNRLGDSHPRPKSPQCRTAARRLTPCYSEGNVGTRALKRRSTPYYLDEDVDIMKQSSSPYYLPKHLMRDSDTDPWLEAEESDGCTQTSSTCSSESPALHRRPTPHHLDATESYNVDVAIPESPSTCET